MEIYFLIYLVLETRNPRTRLAGVVSSEVSLCLADGSPLAVSSACLFLSVYLSLVLACPHFLPGVENTHSSILPGESHGQRSLACPWDHGQRSLQSMVSPRVGYDWATDRGRQSRWTRAHLDDVILTWPVRASADGFVGGTLLLLSHFSRVRLCVTP